MRGFAPWTLSATLAMTFGACLPAAAAHEPLVLAPPPAVAAWPDPASLALDVTLPTLSSGAMLLLIGKANGNLYAQYGALAGALSVPSAVLVGIKDQPFALDSYFASTTGGILGLLLGFGISFLLFPGQISPAALPGETPIAEDPGTLSRLIFMALGQGLGAATGYVLYQHAKPTLADLNRLPEHRKDDPLNWDRWKERHRNE
jgi:hypothetical protein